VKYVVASVADIPPGTHKIVTVGGRSIGVYNVSGEFFALLNRCPHQGGPLCEGLLHGLLQSSEPGEYLYSRPGEILRCPWHGWEYDIRTGQSWYDPRRVRVRAYEVSVEPGSALLDPAASPIEGDPAMGGMAPGPYVVETFPVAVEERYVVVEI
jgi:3-phenylpropionate/trans-cinnamate dioxygenase ferredoxin subunit